MASRIITGLNQNNFILQALDVLMNAANCLPTKLLLLQIRFMHDINRAFSRLFTFLIPYQNKCCGFVVKDNYNPTLKIAVFFYIYEGFSLG